MFQKSPGQGHRPARLRQGRNGAHIVWIRGDQAIPQHGAT